jgi:ABC-type transport system involved in multi-copper enzyme maturation permease subunit
MGEKMRRGEMLICSLPVTRTTIIRGKYLAASLIAIGGMTLWFLYACLLNLFFTDSPGDFHLFTNPIVIFFILFYFSFFISVFFPIVTIFEKIWALTNLWIFFAAIFIVPFSLYYETRGLLLSEFKTGNILFISLLTAIMIILPWLSIALSNRLFKRREL